MVCTHMIHWYKTELCECVCVCVCVCLCVCELVEDTSDCDRLLCTAVHCNDLVWSLLHTICQVRNGVQEISLS